MSYDPTVSTLAAPPPASEDSPQPIAHWTHTIVVLAVIAITALVARTRAASVIGATPRLLRYTSMVMWEWLLLGSA